MTTIELGNMGSQLQAKHLENVLSGQTFYNFIVDYSPMHGNWPVSISTDRPDTTEDELKDMVLFVLALEV